MYVSFYARGINPAHKANTGIQSQHTHTNKVNTHTQSPAFNILPTNQVYHFTSK